MTVSCSNNAHFIHVLYMFWYSVHVYVLHMSMYLFCLMCTMEFIYCAHSSQIDLCILNAEIKIKGSTTAS